MRIAVGRLRQIIKEEAARLVEAGKAPNKPPPASPEASTWNEFREWVGHAMTQADVPEHIVDEVTDLGYMGGDLLQRLREAWREWESQGYDLYEDFLEHEVVPAVITHLSRRRDVDDAEQYRQPLTDALLSMP